MAFHNKPSSIAKGVCFSDTLQLPMTLKVDTFEQDIAAEIKRKDASLTDISAAKNDVGNDAPMPKQTPIFLIVLIILFVIALCGMLGLAYFYFTDSLLPPSQQPVTIKADDAPKANTALVGISPVLAREIGTFVSSVEKVDSGYVLTINNYSAVFAYMTRNENAYIDQLALLFPVSITNTVPAGPVLATTTPPVATTTPTSTATTTSTSTSKTAIKKTPIKSTKTTPTKPSTSTPMVATTSDNDIVVSTMTPAIPAALATGDQVNDQRFKDVTLSNQNMRVWTSTNHVVVYSFLGTTKVLISNSPQGILTLRSAILH